jgi:pyruvate formate lyase activating enzyme
VVSTYNEPLITSEWAVEVFKQARAAGLATGFVSNGNGTPQVLEYLRPWVDLYKVDLKSFEDRHYRQLGGRMQPILETIRRLHEMGFWVEIVTLIVPGFNDSNDELNRMAGFLAGVSPDIPWHVTAFHKDYKMTKPENTSSQTLERAARIGKGAGLRFVYAGNLPGRTGGLENTYCPNCQELLVERVGFHVLDYRLTATGSCPGCGTAIPGRWAAEFQGQIADFPYLPRSQRFDRIRAGRR